MTETKRIKLKGTLAIGDTLTIPYIYKRNNVAIDITGFTFETYITTDPDAAVPSALHVTTAVHTDPTNGITEIEFTAAETATLTEGKYYIIIRIVNTSNEVATPLIIEATFINAGEQP